MKTIGIGIIGSGGIAQGAHLPAYKAVAEEDVQVVAVADVRRETAEQAAKKFEVPHVYEDYRELLKRSDVHAVSVCTPNFMHMQPTIDALEAGKHVLVEKPLAMNAEEGRQMIAAARRTGCKLQAGLNNRFGSGPQALKRFIQAGELGDVYYARSQALRRRGIPSWGVFTQKDKQGGGPLIDIGVHILDLTLWLMGHPKPISASGMVTTRFGKRSDILGLLGQWDPEKFTVEDFGVGFIRFENGATLTLETSFAANLEKEIFNCDLYGTEGGCSLSPLKIYLERHKTLLDATPVSLPNVHTHQAEIRSFIEAIRNDTEPVVTGEQALMVTEILDGIYRSAEEGREVPIESGVS
jgi:predicted dehydrogenase